MLGQKQTRLIIVCDEKTKEYANYLRQLVSVNDDKDDETVGTKDGCVEVAVWTEDNYLNNQPTISSNEHILFIGDNKTSKSEIKNMQINHDKFGMKYGWLGKRAMMLVDDAKLNKEEYDKFIKYCAEYKQYFEKLAYNDSNKEEAIEDVDKHSNDVMNSNEEDLLQPVNDEIKHPNKDNKFVKAIKSAGLVLVQNIIEPAVQYIDAAIKGAYNEIEALAVQKKIKDQQYRALTIIMYLDGLNEFLKG